MPILKIMTGRADALPAEVCLTCRKTASVHLPPILVPDYYNAPVCWFQERCEAASVVYSTGVCVDVHHRVRVCGFAVKAGP